MAYIEQERRSDGGTSYAVRWRLGGTRSGRKQRETFSAGTDAQNKARAEGFRDMVTAAGEFWPDGWVQGRGFVRERTDESVGRLEAPRSVEEVGLEYVDQIIDCSPGQRSRYKGQLRTLKAVEVRGKRGTYRPFDQRIDLVSEDDVKAWLIGWKWSLKTKANYHGLLYGVFTYAAEHGEVAKHPLTRTAPKRSKIKQSQADLRFLTEAEFATVAQLAGDAADLLRVAVGTGLRFGEMTALWVSDVDLRHRTVRVNKAWKRDGEDGEQDVPGWLKKLVRAKHRMRGHHLGNPKTPKSKRTIEVSPEVMAVLMRAIGGKAADDFVFVSPTGLPIHHADFYERIWTPLIGAIKAKGVAPFRIHDLRHTHVSWLIAGGLPLPNIQARLGHESITTTIDTYGHLMPVGNELASQIIDTALRGEEIHPAPAMKLIPGGRTEGTSSEAVPASVSRKSGTAS